MHAGAIALFSKRQLNFLLFKSYFCLQFVLTGNCSCIVFPDLAF